MLAVTAPPPRPESELLSDACTLNEPTPKKSASGVNFKPAWASAKVMKSPPLICVVPSFLNSLPLLIAVTLKYVTSVAVGGVARHHQARR